jgi:hypothetical protein
MAIEPKIRQGRNELCKCGSGLKFKWCHGDPSKTAVLERIVQEAMERMIMDEKHRRKLITDQEYNTFLKKRSPDAIRPPVTQSDIQDALTAVGLKRCSGFLCNNPIPDKEVLCPVCKKKANNQSKGK